MLALLRDLINYSSGIHVVRPTKARALLYKSRQASRIPPTEFNPRYQCLVMFWGILGREGEGAQHAAITRVEKTKGPYFCATNSALSKQRNRLF